MSVDGGTMQRPAPYTCMKSCSGMGLDLFAIQDDRCWCAAHETVTIGDKQKYPYERYGEAGLCSPCKGHPNSVCGSSSTIGVYAADDTRDMSVAVSDGQGGFDFQHANVDAAAALRFRNAAANIRAAAMTSGDFNGDGQVKSSYVGECKMCRM